MSLYRALRNVEIASGNILIPKTQSQFLAHPRLPNVLPFILGEHEEHAVREHQWNGRFPTRGISCTSDWNIAVRYAQQSRVIVTIDEDLCERHDIKRYRVRDILSEELIEHPEDEEVILVADKDGPFPGEIIIRTTVI